MNYVKKEILDSKYKTLFIACGISVLSGVCLLTTILIMTVIPMSEGIFLRMTVPTFFSLVVFPIFLAKLFRFESKIYIKWKQKEVLITVISILFFSGIYYKLNSTKLGMLTTIFLLVHFMIAAFSEEFIYRFIIFNELAESWNLVMCVILSSLIFALVGHIGESVIDNLLYRFPLGVIFALVKIKTKSILYTSVLHGAYNLILII